MVLSSIKPFLFSGCEKVLETDICALAVIIVGNLIGIKIWAKIVKCMWHIIKIKFFFFVLRTWRLKNTKNMFSENTLSLSKKYLTTEPEITLYTHELFYVQYPVYVCCYAFFQNNLTNYTFKINKCLISSMRICWNRSVKCYIFNENKESVMSVYKTKTSETNLSRKPTTGERALSFVKSQFLLLNNH